MFPRKRREGSPMGGAVTPTPKRESILTHFEMNQGEKIKKVNTRNNTEHV